MKWVAVIVLTLSLIVSGCTYEETPQTTTPSYPAYEQTPETPAEQTPEAPAEQTPEIPVEQTPETPAEQIPEIPAEQTPAPVPVETATPPLPDGEQHIYSIKIDDAIFLPIQDWEIQKGDILIWRNREEWKRSHYLVSENGLWEKPKSLPYLRSFSYTFNETGTYTVYLQGYQHRKMMIQVT